MSWTSCWRLSRLPAWQRLTGRQGQTHAPSPAETEMPLSPSSIPSNRRTDRGRDMALVARARAGDALAFEAIMRQHNRLVFRCVRGVITDEAEAQDVVQE